MNVLQHPFSIAHTLINIPYLFLSIHLSDTMTYSEILSLSNAWLMSPNLELSCFIVLLFLFVFHFLKKSVIYFSTGHQFWAAHACTIALRILGRELIYYPNYIFPLMWLPNYCLTNETMWKKEIYGDITQIKGSPPMLYWLPVNYLFFIN